MTGYSVITTAGIRLSLLLAFFYVIIPVSLLIWTTSVRGAREASADHRAALETYHDWLAGEQAVAERQRTCLERLHPDPWFQGLIGITTLGRVLVFVDLGGLWVMSWIIWLFYRIIPT